MVVKTRIDPFSFPVKKATKNGKKAKNGKKSQAVKKVVNLLCEMALFYHFWIYFTTFGFIFPFWAFFTGKEKWPT